MKDKIFFFKLKCDVRYEITGEGYATTLFEINPNTGVIKLKADLNEDDATKYIVSIVSLLTFMEMNTGLN